MPVPPGPPRGSVPGARAPHIRRNHRGVQALHLAAGRVRVIVLVLVFVAGIAAVGALNVGIAVTNEMEFCVSCHTMQTNYLEYQETPHFKNRSGVQATCSDCHVPKPFGPKMVTKVVAAKDVWHEILGTIDTPEKFEARRWVMANRVWDKMRRTDSRECRSCHEFSSMDLSEQDRSARSRHASAEEKGQTCIDCHAGVVHAMPEEPAEPAPKPDAKPDPKDDKAAPKETRTSNTADQPRIGAHPPVGLPHAADARAAAGRADDDA